MYNEQSIRDRIETTYMGKNVSYFDIIDSTNNKAKELARQGAKEGHLVVADQQQAGRGRLGRAWCSPSGTGIWMSFILRPDIEVQRVPQVTLVAGLSMCETIRECTGLDAKIKWPNDIVVQGKKVCGILAEMGMQGGKMLYVILGIGVNVNTECFPDELLHASSLGRLGGCTYGRSVLIADFAVRFERYYEQFKKADYIPQLVDKYKKMCVTLGKQAKLVEKEEERIVYVVDLLPTGALQVINEAGEKEEIQSGEVSIRGIYGYTS
ncbi:MAG: biotin--[acetyl-CoA-carboxylase] ligase [Cellulosilyticaceae bacterium]